MNNNYSLKSAFTYVRENKWKVIGATTVVSVGVWYYRASQRRQKALETHHKNQVVQNATEITNELLAALVPQLQRRLNEVSQIPEILEQVRKPDIPREEKLALWDKLKLASMYL